MKKNNILAGKRGYSSASKTPLTSQEMEKKVTPKDAESSSPPSEPVAEVTSPVHPNRLFATMYRLSLSSPQIKKSLRFEEEMKELNEADIEADLVEAEGASPVSLGEFPHQFVGLGRQYDKQSFMVLVPILGMVKKRNKVSIQ